LKRFDFLTSNKEQAFAGTDFKGGRVTSEIQTFFRPSDVAVGADGAIYVADWFDPRVGGHDDKDDSTSGAIYRIAPKNFRPRVPQVDLSTIEGQIAALRSPAVNVRALGFMRLHARGASAIPTVAKLLDDENPFIRARAVWLLAQLGPKGIERVKARLSSADAMERIVAYRALRAVKGVVPEIASRLAQDPSSAVRRVVALSLRDVSFEQSGDILLALAKGYDGKDRAYLEAWGIGATNKEQPLYAALSATRPDRDPANWPTSYADLIWRLTPPDAVSAFAARATASALEPRERTKAMTALGFIPTKAAADALLDIAQHGDADIKENPALWWLINYKDSRWAGFGVEAELKRRGLYDPDAVEINEITVPAPPHESALPPIAAIARLNGDRQRGAEAARACLMCHRVGDQGVDYAPALDGFASRQTKEVVITAIVDPSSDIAHGYEGTELMLRDGRKIHGLVLSSGNPVIVQSTGGAIQMIPASLIQQRQRLGRSLMLSADQLGLTPQQIADIVAYLE
jgi:putative heme-binding domain-containing protein